MEETLTQRRRVSDEGLRVVKLCRLGKNTECSYHSVMMVPAKEAPANSVPAAAVIQRVRALFGITGRKARVGGLESQV
jgi:hypothetical protein